MEVQIAGFTVLVDECDLDLVERHRWWIKRSSYTNYVNRHVSSRKVAGRVVDRKITSLHREILGLLPGDPRVGDHINGDGLDNRRCNLRICTQAENRRNRRANRNSASGLKGVTPVKATGKWRSMIRVNGRRRHIGTFDTPEAAHAAYVAVAAELHGEFMRAA